MKISAIIPAHNVEDYLEECINSILCQEIETEIIIINDGSTDETGNIADRYQKDHENIFVIHQSHTGPSGARNRGLEIAKGDYIAFIDSDDWIENDILPKLYKIAKESDADMVMGNNIVQFPDGSQKHFFDIQFHLKNRTYSGEKFFISLMETNAYYPMIWSYIYKREWIYRINLRFDQSLVVHEDEMWTQIALCKAERVVVTDLDFYNYRKRIGSLMEAFNYKMSWQGLLYVIKQILLFVAEYDKKNEDLLLKSWIYINLTRMRRSAWNTLLKIKDSSYLVPDDTIDLYNEVQEFMPLKANEKCQEHYSLIERIKEEYEKWKNNSWNSYLSQLMEQKLQGKRIILFYNKPEYCPYETLLPGQFPTGYVLTDDRKYRDQAFAVVFHLPDLADYLDDDLDKQEGQYWVGWTNIKEEDDSMVKDEEVRGLFDMWLIKAQISETPESRESEFKEFLTELFDKLNLLRN